MMRKLQTIFLFAAIAGSIAGYTVFLSAPETGQQNVSDVVTADSQEQTRIPLPRVEGTGQVAKVVLPGDPPSPPRSTLPPAPSSNILTPGDPRIRGGVTLRGGDGSDPGTFTAVQSAVGQGDTGSGSVSASLTGVSDGNLLVIWLGHEDGTGLSGLVHPAPTVTDDLGAHLVRASFREQSNHYAGFHYMLSANGGNRTFTANFVFNQSYRRMLVWEFSYSGGAVRFDAESINSASSGTAITSGAISTTYADAVVFGAEYNHSGDTKTSPTINGAAATGIVKDSPERYAALWYVVQTSTFAGGNAAVTQSSSTVWFGDIIAFKLAKTEPALKIR